MSQLYEYLKMAVSNIKANKVRSFLTMLGIIIGISSVILIMSLGNGAKNVITGEMSGIASGQIALYTYDSTPIPKSDRIPKLVENLYAKMPEIESARAVLITESYKQTENEPMIIRRAKAFQHILENIPITIRDLELVVGSSTLAPRGCQTFPEFSYEWLEAEFDTVETRSADPFYISEQTKKEL